MSQSDWMWSVKGLPYDPILTQPFCCTQGIQQIFPDSALLLRITFWFASCLTFSFIFMKEAKLPKHFYLKSFRGFVGVWVVSRSVRHLLHLVLFFNRFDGRGRACTSTTTQFQLCNHGLYIYCRKKQIWLCFNHLFIEYVMECCLTLKNVLHRPPGQDSTRVTRPSVIGSPM